MAGETEQIKYQLTVEGQLATVAAFESAAKSIDNAAKALEKAASQSKKTEPALKSNAKAANDNARAFDELARGATRITPAFSAMGAAIGRLNPEIGAMGTALGRAGGAMSGMTAIIGGVGGIAAGGLVAGLGLLADYLQRTKKEAEALADAEREATEAMRAFDDAARDRRQGQRQSANEWAAGLGMNSRARGLARDLEQARANRALLGPASKSIGGGVTLDNPLVAAADAEIARLQRELDKEKKKGPDRDQGDDKKAKEPGRPDTEWETQQRRQGVDDTLKALDKLQQQSTLDQRAEAGKDAIERRKAEFEEITRAAEESSRQRMELLDKEEKKYGELRDAGEDAFMTIGRHAANALAAIAVGQKVVLKDVIAGIGQELVAKGVMWGFEGTMRLIKSYGADPSGWEMVAQGAAATAAGFAMGAIGTYGNSSGGAGPTRQVSPADPYAAPDTTGGRSATTINVNLSSVVSPNAHDAVRIQQAMDEGRRQGLVAA